MNEARDYILVIEDDPNLLLTIRMILEDAGYHVMTAMNGLEGLGIASSGLPKLIVLDMKMPVMDGWEFARHFYETHGRSTPILVLTAAEDARQRAAEIQAPAFLGKPFDVDEFLALIAKTSSNF